MVLIKRISAVLVAAVIFSAPVMTAFVSLQSAPAAAQTPAAEPAKPAEAAASPAAAMTAPIAAPVSSKDELGVKAIWDKADLVAKFVLFILVVMSMGSWYILIVKFFEQRRLMKESKAATETFWNAGSLAQGMSTLHEDSRSASLQRAA